MALGLKPRNLPTTLLQLHNISDEIWDLAGDKSTDYNWYTKRAILTKIYVATEVYMLQDKSNNHEATWEFLDRRMNDQKNFADLLKGSKGFTDSL